MRRVQITNAQKARLKREQETLQVSLCKAAAERERADTVAYQLRADLADMSAERDATLSRDQHRAQQLQQQITDLERRLQRATCPDAGVDRFEASKENLVAEVTFLPQWSHQSPDTLPAWCLPICVLMLHVHWRASQRSFICIHAMWRAFA